MPVRGPLRAGVVSPTLAVPKSIERPEYVGRSAVASHRRSVRVGVRLGRWQTVLVAVMVAALIGGAR